MSRSFIAAMVAGLLVIGTALVGAPASAQSSSGSASDVGVTAKTIRVAVVTDVDNPIVPGVLQGIVDGVRVGASTSTPTAASAGARCRSTSSTRS